MSLPARLSRIFSTGEISSYLNGTANLATGSRGFQQFGAYQCGGRTTSDGGDRTYRVAFLQYVTDTWSEFGYLPCIGTNTNGTTWDGWGRGSSMSNYRNAGYLGGGGFEISAASTFTQKLDYSNRTWTILGRASVTCHRSQTWGTTNPATAGYTYGGYITQGSVIGSAGVDKFLYSTESASLLSSYFSGNRGLSSGACHNGTTAAYQMGGGEGAAGGYGSTTRISKIVYSTDTTSVIAGTLAGASRDLNAATQNGSTAAYAFSGRGGGTQVDKMPFSTETCSLLASGHSADVGNGSNDGGHNNNGVAIYHSGGANTGNSNLIDKWNVASGDTRSSFSVSGRANTWEMNTLSNTAVG